MSSFSRCLSKRSRLVSAFFLTLMLTAQAWAGSTSVVISQIYGAGGNSGAVLDSDFVELFNISSAPVSLSGWSIQYISSAGTAATAGTSYSLPNVTLQPGQYFMMKGAAGGTCTTSSTPACPTFPADGTSSINLSGTTGKVFLVNTTTLLTGVTPTGTSGASTCTVPSSVVDYVGFGASATCAEGGKFTTPNATAAQSIIRTNVCIDTDVNSADFSNVTPAPHSSATTPTPCSTSTGATAPTVTAAISPTSQTTGLSVLLTGVVQTGTSPASTGITVTADLSALGGSATQPLNDAGSNGDVTAGDGTYSYKFTIPSSQTTGIYKLTLTVSDTQLRNSTSSTNLTVTAPVVYVPIHTIQGSMGSGQVAPTASSYIGQVVQTSGIVTGILNNGYYIQARDNAADNDPTTPEALFVYTGSGLVPSTATIGTEIQVTGTATLYPSGETLAGLELKGLTGYSVLTTGNTLPAAITLTTSSPSPSGGPYQLMRYQSMRVSVPSFTATEGTQGSLAESDEIYTSNGQFYGTVTGVTRPLREPGLEVLDPLTASYPNITKFDDNPEVIPVDSVDMQGGAGTPIDLATGAVLTNMSGIMDFSGIEYNANSGSGPQLGAGPVFMIDATTRPTVTGGMTVVSVPAAKANELTIGDQNMERFYNATADTAGAVVLTSAAYQLRLSKASIALRNVLGMPDILCLEEMENLATLTDLSKKISADALAAGQTDPLYQPYLIQGNDSSAINVAFLVKPSKVNVIDVSQFGKTTTYTNSTGAQAVLNDRPPLVLHAGIKRSGVADYPLTIIVNHLRSLNGVTDPTSTGQSVRLKREAQAEFLANLIQGYQANGEHVISVGDYNAFEFNDGLVDSIDIVRGIATTASQDVVPGPSSPLVTPALADLAPTSLATGAYSYAYVGDAQSIDHFFATSDIAGLIHTAPAHFDADFPAIYRNDPSRPEVSSDHDGIVGYLAVPSGTVITLSSSSLTFTSQPLNTPSTSQPVTVTNTGTAAITITSITTTAGFTQTNNCGTSLAGGANCIVNVVFQPTATGPQTGTLTLNDSDANKTQTVSLSGTGAGIFSAILLTAAPSSAVSGTNVVLTATLSGNSTNLPSGSVTFFSNGTSIGTAAITAGVATLTTKTLPVGTDAITATYGGDSVYPMVSTGAAVTVTITAAPVPDFTFSISNTAIIATGSSPTGTATLNVTMINGFSQPVTFSCAGLPSNSHCNFSPATLTASGASTLTVVINQASLIMPTTTPSQRDGGIAVALLLGLPLLLRRRSLRSKLRRSGGLFLALLLGISLTALSGCGNGANTAKGTTTVTVTATGGTISHNATFTLNVQ